MPRRRGLQEKADFGAASTHGGHHCTDCKHYTTKDGRTVCDHPLVYTWFSLGTHFDRMGCRNGFEPLEGKK